MYFIYIAAAIEIKIDCWQGMTRTKAYTQRVMEN